MEHNKVITPDVVIQAFLKSLGETLLRAENASKLGLAPRYHSALQTFRDYGSLIELAFGNQEVVIQELLYFGKRGGRIGVPISITTFVPEDEEGGDDDVKGE